MAGSSRKTPFETWTSDQAGPRFPCSVQWRSMKDALSFRCGRRVALLPSPRSRGVQLAPLSSLPPRPVLGLSPLLPSEESAHLANAEKALGQAQNRAVVHKDGALYFRVW